MHNINTIVQELNNAKQAYYDGNSIMSDREFDELELILKSLDSSHSYFNQVGAAIRGEKVKLKVPMGSLNQLYEDNFNWVTDIVSQQDVTLSAKLDGSSVQLIYNHLGEFSQAITRGDGIEGLDITRHIRRILQGGNPCIPLIFVPDAVVRAEAIMSHMSFDIINRDGKYKNARNYVAGQLNRKVCDQSFVDRVSIVAFDYNNGTQVMDKEDQFKKLVEGFEIPDYFLVLSDTLTPEYLTEFIYNLEEYPFQCDGVVIDIDDASERERLGHKNLNPEYARKFKININRAETTVVGVHWQASKHGYMKPRVEIEPVELDGVTITFATGFNAKFIKEKGIGPGAKIIITRSGQVIPFLEEVLISVDPQMPEGDLDWNETGVDLVSKTLSSDSYILQNVDFFAAINAPLMKLGNITKLYEGGLETIAQIINADIDQLIEILGEANATKIHQGLFVVLNPIENWKLAGATNFFGRGIGQIKIKKLTERYSDFSTNLSLSDILIVEGFDDKSATKVANGMSEWQKFLDEIGDKVSVTTPIKIDGDLNGVVVAFTGVRSSEVESQIVSRGGKVASSLTNSVTVLVAKDPDSQSGKLIKARQRGVKIYSLEQYHVILDG